MTLNGVGEQKLRRTGQREHFPSWPFFATDEIDACTAILSSGIVNGWQGMETREFQRDFAEQFGDSRALALSSGTVALEFALRALDIGAGDEVIVPATGFIADATSPMVVGAAPVFADVNRDTQTISAASIRPLITERTRAIIVVHLGGVPCDMDEILSLAQEHDLKIIEDCAQAQGARYKDRYVGGLGDAAAFSFCNDKIMSTGGEGGMLLLKEDSAWDRAWSAKDHGKHIDCLTDQRPFGPYRYVHDTMGSNYRMTEMQAAIGRVQLRKLADWLKIRNRNATRLRQGLAEVPGIYVPDIPDYAMPAWYKAYAYVEPEYLKDEWSRNQIIEEINAAGVPCGSGGCPELYREKVIIGRGLAPKQHCAVAREIGKTSLMFRVDPALDAQHMDRTVEVVSQVMRPAVGE